MRVVTEGELEDGMGVDGCVDADADDWIEVVAGCEEDERGVDEADEADEEREAVPPEPASRF